MTCHRETSENLLDLRVTDTADGNTYGIEVKNTREPMFANSPWIEACKRKADANNVKPWIVPAFATADAIRACRAKGLRCTPIGKRIAPETDKNGRSMRRWLRDELYPVHGPEPFAFIGKHRLRGEQPELVDQLRNLS